MRGRKSRWITAEGYAIVKVDGGQPNCDRQNLIPEHRLVMAQMLGRPLIKGEEIHHRNGIRNDNRPENLELWTRNHPTGVRATDLVAFAVDVLERYAPDLLAEPVANAQVSGSVGV